MLLLYICYIYVDISKFEIACFQLVATLVQVVLTIGTSMYASGQYFHMFLGGFLLMIRPTLEIGVSYVAHPN